MPIYFSFSLGLKLLNGLDHIGAVFARVLGDDVVLGRPRPSQRPLWTSTENPCFCGRHVYSVNERRELDCGIEESKLLAVARRGVPLSYQASVAFVPSNNRKAQKVSGMSKRLTI